MTGHSQEKHKVVPVSEICDPLNPKVGTKMSCGQNQGKCLSPEGLVTFLPGTKGQLKTIQGGARGTNWGADKQTEHR